MEQLYTSFDQVKLKRSWVTIGSFDGVHLGHRAILDEVVASAHAASQPAVVITFHPHPGFVLRGQTGPFYLTLPDERAEIFFSLGVDVVIIQPFNLTLASTSAEQFISRMKVQLGIEHLWVGQDFALGRGRAGNVARLIELGEQYRYQVHTVVPKELRGYVVSSSRIRASLSQGKVQEAAQLLGRFYAVQGEVTRGDGRGRRIGIPTANLITHPEKRIPASGVYVCQTVIEGILHPAATNIGIRPTFDGKSEIPQVEAHILDFDGDLYGAQLRLEFLQRLRGEQRFPDTQTLVEQIHQDILQTGQIVSSLKNEASTSSFRGKTKERRAKYVL